MSGKGGSQYIYIYSLNILANGRGPQYFENDNIIFFENGTGHGKTDFFNDSGCESN